MSFKREQTTLKDESMNNSILVLEPSSSIDKRIILDFANFKENKAVKLNNRSSGRT